MSSKPIAKDATIREAARKIEFVAGVRKGLAEIDSGQRIPIEEIERELPTWVEIYEQRNHPV